MKERYFTSGECARFMHCSMHTVAKMTDQGKLRSYKIGNRRRIAESDLVTFMKANRIPIPCRLSREYSVLFVGINPPIDKPALYPNLGYTSDSCTLMASFLLGLRKPEIVVLNAETISRSEIESIASLYKNNLLSYRPRIILCEAEDSMWFSMAFTPDTIIPYPALEEHVTQAILGILCNMEKEPINGSK